MGVTIQPIVQSPHYDQHVRSRCHAYENEIPKLGRTAAPPSPAMNSRRLIGDPPRLFRVSLSRFRLGGNRLIAGVFAAPQESAPGPTRKEGVGVNHWRLTVYQRTCRGLGSPPGLGVGDERSGPLRSAPQVHVVPLPAPRPRARKEIIVPGGHNSSPRRLNHALVLAIARAKSWMRGASQGFAVRLFGACVRRLRCNGE